MAWYRIYMEANDTIYSNGDLCELTGYAMDLYGGIFHEAEVLEGSRKGDLIVISDDYINTYGVN